MDETIRAAIAAMRMSARCRAALLAQCEAGDPSALVVVRAWARRQAGEESETVRALRAEVAALAGRVTP